MGAAALISGIAAQTNLLAPHANDTGAAAGEVLAAAEDLSHQAGQLQAEMADFVAGVRAA